MNGIDSYGISRRNVCYTTDQNTNEPMKYESTVLVQSQVAPEVAFKIFRMSFGRRIELTRRVRELAQRIEFLEAGVDFKGKLDAALVLGEVEKLYLQWGLKSIGGLWIDGHEATVETMVTDGPEDLCKEAVSAIKHECGLTEEERKN
jgi:hypothetical protein